jgi:hypothetical protein
MEFSLVFFLNVYRLYIKVTPNMGSATGKKLRAQEVKACKQFRFSDVGTLKHRYLLEGFLKPYRVCAQTGRCDMGPFCMMNWSHIQCDSWTARLQEQTAMVRSRNWQYLGAGSWRWIASRRKLHNEELRSSYPSPSIIRIIKSRRMRFGEGGQMTRVRAKRNACILFWWESRRERDG